MIHAVIMAGGSGTRFWPASRGAWPKQLLPIGTDRPLVEETLDRLAPLIPAERTLIVTNAMYADMTAELLSEVPRQNIIGEPTGRDTAACIGLAALILKKRDPDAVMAVMPSDHIIRPAGRFRESLEAAETVLKGNRDALITFGIRPAFPATGYGYILKGDPVTMNRDFPFFEVQAFREKPDLETARGFLEAGGYCWNAGIFCWRADTILSLLARLLPELHKGLLELTPVVDREGFNEALATVYPGLTKISIDIGVMEKAERRIVAEVDYAWDDVGSWAALPRLIKADDDGQVVQGEVVSVDSKNNIVAARGGVVGLVNVEGLIVVHTPDATLVCHKEDAERVKTLVEKLDPEYR